MARQVSFSINQGATYTANIPLYDVTGSVIILTGYTVSGHMATSYYSYENAFGADASPIIQFTCSIVDATNGIIQLSLTATQTAGLSTDDYVYTVSITDVAGNVTRVLNGVITINPDITLIIVPPAETSTWQHIRGESMIVL